MEKENGEKQNSETQTSSDKKNAVIKEIISWVKMLVVCFVVALAVNSFLIVNAQIPSGSMENTIHPGDRVVGSRLTYLHSDPQRGDIIIFKYPVDDALGKKNPFIKRVIGLPGETVEIKNAKVYINGSDTPLDEPYLKEEWITRNDGMVFHVPEDSYFMMGDNRNNSSDSRYWAEKAILAGLAADYETAEQYSYVHRSQILGKAYFRYWPLNKICVLE